VARRFAAAEDAGQRVPVELGHSGHHRGREIRSGAADDCERSWHAARWDDDRAIPKSSFRWVIAPNGKSSRATPGYSHLVVGPTAVLDGSVSSGDLVSRGKGG
jgi:hypothetical protein